jgi:hypothetical protein
MVFYIPPISHYHYVGLLATYADILVSDADIRHIRVSMGTINKADKEEQGGFLFDFLNTTSYI